MGDLIQLSFQREINEIGNENKFFNIYYILKGKATVYMSNKTFDLGAYDIVVINPNDDYRIYGINLVIAKFSISVKKFLSLTGNKKKYVVCNTVREKNDNFEKLQKLLDLLINSIYENEYGKLVFEKYSYDLVLFLISEFTNNTYFDLNIDKRKEDIENYIETNYNSDISLESISENFGLTPQYFSKYFKDTFGITFLKYLNKVRVQNARENLENSNSTILKIALDNGFPNITSFTRAFNDFYGMNASNYRLESQKKKVVGCLIPLDEVSTYLKKEKEDSKYNAHIVNIDGKKEKEELKQYWFNICNIGAISRVFNSGIKEQISELQRELGFEFVRVELDTFNLENLEHCFFQEEKVFDFFISENLKVIAIIDFRQFNEEKDFLKCFKMFVRHFINRYGEGYIKGWKFELFYDSDFKEEKNNKYKKFYEDIELLLESFDIKGRLLGPGLLLDQEGENLRRFIKNNKQIKEITISVAPYSIEEERNVFVNRTSDSDYVLNQYNLAKKICEEEGAIDKIYISSWKEVLGSHSIIYDSSYRAASILKNYINGYSILNTLPIDKLLDLMFEGRVDNKILSGLSGILTTKGIKKPAFYAYKYLKKLDRYFVYKDNYTLVTNSKSKYYQIVCHNCKKLNYKFYSQEISNIEAMKIDELFQDNEKKIIQFKFKNLENGVYFMKSRSVSEKKGSVLSILAKMNFKDEAFFGLDEIDYLQSLSKPSIKGQIFTVNDGELDFQCELEANEIRHLHLIFVH